MTHYPTLKRNTDDALSTGHLKRDVYKISIVPDYRRKSLQSISENKNYNNGYINRLGCLNMLSKLESYSADLDDHLNLFSKLEYQQHIND